MELLRIGITGLDDKLWAVAFLFSLTDPCNGVLPLLLCLFIPVKAPDTQPAFNGLLTFVTPALDFFQVFSEVIL